MSHLTELEVPYKSLIQLHFCNLLEHIYLKITFMWCPSSFLSPISRIVLRSRILFMCTSHPLDELCS